MGQRPIDLHIKGFKQLGAEIKEEYGFLICSANKLRGAKINLDFPSVGATENLMLAAVKAEGETIISNAAKEPEIVDMQNFLNGMGAKVRGAGTDTITIEGINTLHDVEHNIIPDRIVAGTMLTAAAMTKGAITLEQVIPEHLYPITSKLVETGCLISIEKDKIKLKAPETIKSVGKLRTHPHPGFPTDMQPQIMALMSIADGISVIQETVFESRNKHVNELNRLGANIILSQDGMTSVIKGVKKLTGTTVESKDLRGGAALIMAGLVTEGETIVLNSKHVERGYENIQESLSAIGADIKYFHE